MHVKKQPRKNAVPCTRPSTVNSIRFESFQIIEKATCLNKSHGMNLQKMSPFLYVYAQQRQQ